MRNKTGKLFQNIQTRKVSAYEYIKKSEEINNSCGKLVSQ